MRLWNITWVFLIVALNGHLTGCGKKTTTEKTADKGETKNTKVTQENFDKVKDSMTEKEVIAIMGEPTRTKEVDVAGGKGKQLIWEASGSSATIDFDAKGKQVGKASAFITVK